MLHTTIARNTGSKGSGVYVTNYGSAFGKAELTNTVLVSHTVGISVTGGNTATVNSILWFGTPILISRAITAAVTVQNQWQGNPAFAADGYHLTAFSAAIDRGVNAGVKSDMDGDPRPVRNGYDLGADEFISARTIVDPVLGGSLTYADARGLVTMVQFPPGAVTRTTDIVYATVPTPTEPVSPGLRFVGQPFDLDAFQNGVRLPNFTFVKTVTATINYSDADVAGIDVELLRLYRWVTGEGWQIIGRRSGEHQDIDTTHYVLKAWLLGLSRFSGQSIPKFSIFVPVVLKNG